MTEPICTPVSPENVMMLLRRLEDETRVKWKSGAQPSLTLIQSNMEYLCFNGCVLEWSTLKLEGYQIVTWNQFVQTVKETVGER